ncbi:MAG: hypothetical protein JXA71_13820 [Chitinispirillaceae bacterium]|nr:hypothetical protein [Chitinispirillaceae bacterium]
MIKTMIGLVVGGLLGFLFYTFVGCTTGTCPITSSPFLTTMFGAIIGMLVVNR